MMTDSQLLLAYVTEGSNPAFAELVRRHVDLVYSVARRKVGGDAHSAQDVCQAVFLALAHNARALAPRRKIAGWLYLTTHNLSAQLVRSDRRRQLRHGLAQAMNETIPSPDLNWDQLRPVLDEGLQRLNAADREAVLLRCIEQRGFAEIGLTLEVSEDAARMRVDRALEKLRGFLARRGVSSTAAALTIGLVGQASAAPVGVAGQVNQAVAALPPPAEPAGLLSLIRQLSPTMKTSILGTVALAAVALALLQTKAARENATALTVAQIHLEELTSRLSPAPLPAGKLPTQPRTAADAGQVAASAAGGRTRNETESSTALKSRFTPEERRAHLDRAVAFYDPLLLRLKLTPAQAEQFKVLLWQNLSDRTDFSEVSRAIGIKPVDPDIQALVAETDAKLHDQVRATFGDQADATLQHYQATGALRELTTTLTKMLADSPAPLTSEQADQLVEIMNDNQTDAGRTHVNPHTINLPVVLTSSQTILSPAQLAAFRQAQADWH